MVWYFFSSSGLWLLYSIHFILDCTCILYTYSLRSSSGSITRLSSKWCAVHKMVGFPQFHFSRYTLECKVSRANMTPSSLCKFQAVSNKHRAIQTDFSLIVDAKPLLLAAAQRRSGAAVGGVERTKYLGRNRQTLVGGHQPRYSRDQRFKTTVGDFGGPTSHARVYGANTGPRGPPPTVTTPWPDIGPCRRYALWLGGPKITYDRLYKKLKSTTSILRFLVPIYDHSTPAYHSLPRCRHHGLRTC